MAAEMLARAKGQGIFRDYPEGYAITPEDNLIKGVSRNDFWADLTAGDGSELIDTEGAPAKFCAAYSSSALVVNTFGPFRHVPERLALAGLGSFTEAQFEKKLPTGLKGSPPNLDFVASGPGGIVCVESKYLEPLSRKEAKFRPSYERMFELLAEPSWQAMYRTLLDNPRYFVYLDAAQLVKHYLGMCNSLKDINGLVLLYLFWEPANATDIPEFLEHRDEINVFADKIKESEIRFVAMSYPELWDYWSRTLKWSGLNAHIRLVRARYSYSI